MSERTYTLDDFADEVDVAHPLTARRLPVLHGSHARWKYHVALVIGRESWEDDNDAGIEPEPWEIEQLLVYLEKHMRYYNDSYRRQVEARGPFDVDGTVNTHTFRKHPEHGWQYTVATWRDGPTWFPSPWYHKDLGPFTLEALLDRINTFGDGPPMQKWLDLKAESGAFEVASCCGVSLCDCAAWAEDDVVSSPAVAMPACPSCGNTDHYCGACGGQING